MLRLIFEPSQMLRRLVVDHGVLPGSSMTEDWNALVRDTEGLRCVPLCEDEVREVAKKVGPDVPDDLWRVVLPEGWFWTFCSTVSDGSGKGRHGTGAAAEIRLLNPLPTRDAFGGNGVMFRIEVEENVRFST